MRERTKMDGEKNEQWTKGKKEKNKEKGDKERYNERCKGQAV